MGNQLFQRPSSTLFMKFGYLTRHTSTSIPAHHVCQLLKRLHQTIRRLIYYHRARFHSQSRQSRLPAFLLWKEALETKAVIGQPGGHQCRNESSGTWQTLHFYSSSNGLPNKEDPGSEMPGVPASLTKATVCPARSLSTTLADVPCSLNLWCDNN